MAVTKGHGNPNWTRDEVILALDLYFDCRGRVPDKSDARVKALSNVLRAFPHHSRAARKESFRNPDGVAFKLQNLRQVATGKGLGNVSKVDREVWEELGSERERAKELARLIRSGLSALERIPAETEDIEFVEGRVVTETHLRRERSAQLRVRLLGQRSRAGNLRCEICAADGSAVNPSVLEAMFECHHVVPLSAVGEKGTRLKDLALLCANCHRMVHAAIAIQERWISMDEAKAFILAPVTT
jgi:5-methylcytosine-specific restriction protein A